MKKSILFTAMLFTTLLFTQADAQVNVRINIGNQPVWGPVGYDYVDYYYFPDNDVYYNVPRSQFIYFDGRGWVTAYSLPPSFGNFDLYRSYKVVINDPDPFRRNNFYHDRYSQFRGRPQQIIYNSREPKYYVIEKHPEHGRWMESRRNDYARNNSRNDRNGYNQPGRFDNRSDFDRDNNGRSNDRRFENDNNRRFDNDNNDRRQDNSNRNNDRGNSRNARQNRRF